MSSQGKLVLIDGDKMNDVIEILQFYKNQVDLVYNKNKNKNHNFDLLSELLEESYRVNNLINLLKEV